MNANIQAINGYQFKEIITSLGGIRFMAKLYKPIASQSVNWESINSYRIQTRKRRNYQRQSLTPLQQNILRTSSSRLLFYSASVFKILY